MTMLSACFCANNRTFPDMVCKYFNRSIHLQISEVNTEEQNKKSVIFNES